MQELPPRARRIPVPARKKIAQERTTSACAENTPLEGAPYVWGGNYLRVRGEYVNTLAAPRAYTELPPRARRIRGHWAVSSRKNGTTSACAENTGARHGKPPRRRNYLRVRGEYSWKRGAGSPPWELPPRARRILCRTMAQPIVGGTTSACAENTPIRGIFMAARRNYLRVRGEYWRKTQLRARMRELPPRARRILGRLHAHVGVCGTTSACAENTLRGHLKGVTLVNYLRVRGEYHMSHRFNTWTLELPPRARRIQLG